MNMNQVIINGMPTLIHSCDRARFKGICVASDFLRDGAWIASRDLGPGHDPIYWSITEDATGIGFDKSLTVEYYLENCPQTTIAVFVCLDGVWYSYATKNESGQWEREGRTSACNCWNDGPVAYDNCTH